MAGLLASLVGRVVCSAAAVIEAKEVLLMQWWVAIGGVGGVYCAVSCSEVIQATGTCWQLVGGGTEKNRAAMDLCIVGARWI